MFPLNWKHFVFTFLPAFPPQLFHCHSCPLLTHLPCPLMLNLQVEIKPHLFQKTCPEYTYPPQILNMRCSPVINCFLNILFDFSKWTISLWTTRSVDKTFLHY